MAKIYSMKDIKDKVKKPTDIGKKDKKWFAKAYENMESIKITKDTIENLMNEKFDESLKSVAGILEKDKDGKIKKDKDGNPIYKINKDIIVYGGEVDYEVGDKKITGKRTAEEIRHDIYDMIIHKMSKEHEKIYGDSEKKSMTQPDYFTMIENKYGFNRNEFVKHLERYKSNIEAAFRELSAHYTAQTAEKSKESLIKDVDAEDIKTFHDYVSKVADELGLADFSKQVYSHDKGKDGKRQTIMTDEEARRYVSGILYKDKKFISDIESERYHVNRLKNNERYVINDTSKSNVVKREDWMPKEQKKVYKPLDFEKKKAA